MPPAGRGENIIQQKTLFSCFRDATTHTQDLQKNKTSKTAIPTHSAPDMTPARNTQPHPCGKTTHLSEEGKRHQDHMVEVLIRSWGRSTRQGMAPRPPSSPLRYQLCHMGQLLAGEPLAGVHFVSRATRERGSQTRLVCLNRPVM